MSHWERAQAYLEAACNPASGPLPPSTVRYIQVLWMLADCLGITSVLEIGVGPMAVSGSTFILNMASRGGGVLYSVDVNISRPRPSDRALAQDCAVKWTVFHGDSLQLVDQLPKGLQVDLLYIDGDHDHLHAYGDTVAYLPFLRPGGYLVIDDYPTSDGVVSARESLEAEGFTFVHLAHELPHGNGRLLWQKPW